MSAAVEVIRLPVIGAEHNIADVNILFFDKLRQLPIIFRTEQKWLGSEDRFQAMPLNVHHLIQIEGYMGILGTGCDKRIQRAAL